LDEFLICKNIAAYQSIKNEFFKFSFDTGVKNDLAEPILQEHNIHAPQVL
jgi:hypothetical protein